MKPFMFQDTSPIAARIEINVRDTKRSKKTNNVQMARDREEMCQENQEKISLAFRWAVKRDFVGGAIWRLTPESL
jgi:hypothetical protein